MILLRIKFVQGPPRSPHYRRRFGALGSEPRNNLVQQDALISPCRAVISFVEQLLDRTFGLELF